VESADTRRFRIVWYPQPSTPDVERVNDANVRI
jgi:hypothetical protein